MAARRKLAAILFADIAGFTRQVYHDEESGLANRKRVDQTIKACAISRKGRVVKTIGDGEMLEFSSAVEAVGCALDIQQQIQSLKAYSELDTGIYVRIGIHAGDIVKEDGDLYGNAVNIAQRIQEMASPGGICISRDVLSQINPILKLRCEPVTTAPLKPLPEPLEVFQVTTEKPVSAASSLPIVSPRPRGRRVLAPLSVGILALGAVVITTAAILRMHGSTPHIEITHIPPPKERADRVVYGTVAGSVGAINPASCRVVVYELADIWYVAVPPSGMLVTPDSRGEWSQQVLVNAAYAALLVKPSYKPLPMIRKLPASGGDVLAVTRRTAYPSVFVTRLPTASRNGILGPGTLTFKVDSDTSDYRAFVYAKTDTWYLQSTNGEVPGPGHPPTGWSTPVQPGTEYAVVLTRPSVKAAPEFRDSVTVGGDILAVTVKSAH